MSHESGSTAFTSHAFLPLNSAVRLPLTHVPLTADCGISDKIEHFRPRISPSAGYNNGTTSLTPFVAGLFITPGAIGIDWVAAGPGGVSWLIS
ncbi:MAG: hypothetical protein KDA89_23690, partial [Planctomycetaceae bacterium]|nr:hypothetical protein [Planctomycetaceae bacterium]